MRLPNGCSVKWASSPAKQTRLLEWLESHPDERQCLFHEGAFRYHNKTVCSVKAAQAIFSNDENPNNSREVRYHPLPFAQSIRNLIRLVWTSKYRKVNERLGSTNACRPYSDFVVGSAVLKTADAEIVKFPQWVQLHKYWRTLPRFNQYAPVDEPSYPINLHAERAEHMLASSSSNIHPHQSDRRLAGKRKRHETEEDIEDDSATYVHSDSSDSEGREGRRIAKRPTLQADKKTIPVQIDEESAHSTSQVNSESNSHHLQQHAASTTLAGTSREHEYTPDQRFQLELSKIQCETQAHQTKALEIAQKREILMLLFGPRKAD